MYSITRNYDDKGSCIRCPECKSTDIDLQVTFTDEGHLVEADQYCKNCLTKVGYYSYGSHLMIKVYRLYMGVLFARLKECLHHENCNLQRHQI